MRKCPGNGRWSDASRTDVTDPGGHEGGGVCEITAPPSRGVCVRVGRKMAIPVFPVQKGRSRMFQIGFLVPHTFAACKNHDNGGI